MTMNARQMIYDSQYADTAVGALTDLDIKIILVLEDDTTFSTLDGAHASYAGVALKRGAEIHVSNGITAVTVTNGSAILYSL